MNLPPVILASASPRRTELLRQLLADFAIVPSGVEEVAHEQLTVREIAQINAYRKARAVAKKHPDALVLGADTLVCLGPTIFGKPRDLLEAEEMLDQLQGRTHGVVTAVCAVHLRKHWQKLFVETTEVSFRPLSRMEIREYLRSVNPLDKAGAYAIQERGESIVRVVDGSLSNVVGLPVERLKQELDSWHAELPAAVEDAASKPA